jgi:hypothetical protein
MTRSLAALVAAAAVAVAGCGGSDNTPTAAAPASTPAATVPAATTTPSPVATATPSPVATAATPTATPSPAATAATPAPVKHHAKPRATPTAAPPINDSETNTSDPITCLKGAALAKAKRVSTGLWSAASGADEVTVDGPYIDSTHLEASLNSLNGISLAKRGGRYVVTAGLESHLEGKVDKVAGCLKRLS